MSPSLNTTADGSLYFSVRDLIAWDAAVRDRAVLKPASWELILEPVRLASGNTYPYGFGWFLDQRNGQPLQEHSGAWQGFTTPYSRFVGADLSIIVLTNLAGANPARFADGIAGIVDMQLARPLLRPIEDRDPNITARLVRLLDDARSGVLKPSDFAYVSAGFFPDRARIIEEQLRTLGGTQRLALVERVERGDDRIFTYEVTFASQTMHYRVGLAPDNRVSAFELRPK